MLKILWSLLKGLEKRILTVSWNMFADSALWSPPEYNSYEWMSKENLRSALSDYMSNFDNLSFTPGINLPGGNVVDGFLGGV